MSGATPSGFAPPEKFSFEPKEWPFWKQRFERFRQLTKLNGESAEHQINALIYSMGEKADEILSSFNLSEEDAKDYDKVIKRFDNHYVGKRNIVYDRARFGLRNQEEGETIESYVTALHTLAEYCEYKDLKEELIRDRIVLGVMDKKLSEKLMLMGALDLGKAVELCKQWETVKKHQDDLDGKHKSLDAVSRSNDKTPLQSGFSGDDKKMSKACKFCGGLHEWKKEKCPAWGKKCAKCGRANHFAKCCHVKSEGQEGRPGGSSVGLVQSGVEDFFVLSNINAVGSKESASERNERWTATVMMDRKEVIFKLDPGADVTAMSYKEFRRHWSTRKLDASDRKLTGPDATSLSVVGTCKGHLQNKEHEVTETIYVVKGLEKSLLGLRACEDLQLVRRLNNVNIQTKKLTEVEPKTEFPELFTGLGKMEDPYTIKIRDGAAPFAVFTPRRVPIPLMDKVKEKLEGLVEAEVIEKVDEPSDWCAPLVTVPKSNGDLRLCVDLTALNRSVERETHPMPVVEHELGQLAGARIFSKLDANSGFHQIPLSPDCRALTTFITPFGRFRYKRLPFGITSAPEHFQKRMTAIIGGIPGVIVHMDDILIFGGTTEEHDSRLRVVLSKLKLAGLTLNSDKCLFGVGEIQFLGHILSANLIQADPEKVKAINGMREPANVTEVKRFLGMTNFLGKFIPHLSTISKPLYEITRLDKEFYWGPAQKTAFQDIKNILTGEPALAMFDLKKETIVSSDASSFGLGSVLLQKQKDGSIKPIAYASRTMTLAEQRYAQIEKEALAMVWACERFRDFLMGKVFVVQTDHKPLLPIMTTKLVDDLSPRLQRFRIKMMRYCFSIVFVPGKELVAADTLSRQPLEEVGELDEMEEDVKAYVSQVIAGLPVTDEKLSDIWKSQMDDRILNQVMKMCLTKWPDAKEVSGDLRKYWNMRDHLTVQNGLLLMDSRLVIPKDQREEILGKIHEGHFGIVKCRARARESCWWPGISEDVAEVVRRCPICVQERKERKEPLMPLDFPSRPWQRLGMDLFKIDGRWFILVVDYFSRYPEIGELTSMTTIAVVKFLKSTFARHGIPEEVISDNGPQFHPLKTSPFQQFAREYGFNHVTSSPHFPQSNGFVENGVKILKNILTKNIDWCKGLLEYRASPLANGYSPAELLMGRRIRSTLPMDPSRLIPHNVNSEELLETEEKRRTRQKRDYDRRHGVISKDTYQPGEIVWVKDLRSWGTIRERAETPRSFIVDTSRGEYRRNSAHLTRAHRWSVPSNDVDFDMEDEAATPPTNSDEVSGETESSVNPASPQTYTTRSGRHVKATRRYIEEI